MDVVVNVLAGNDGGDGAGLLTLNTLLLVTELGLLLLESELNLLGAVVLERAVLDRHDVVVVLLLKLDAVLDGLDRGVVVVLVHLLVNGSLHLLVLGAVDGLVYDGRGDLLVDGGVVVTRLGPGWMSVQQTMAHLQESTYMKSATAALAESIFACCVWFWVVGIGMSRFKSWLMSWRLKV